MRPPTSSLRDWQADCRHWSSTALHEQAHIQTVHRHAQGTHVGVLNEGGVPETLMEAARRFLRKREAVRRVTFGDRRVMGVYMLGCVFTIWNGLGKRGVCMLKSCNESMGKRHS